MFGKCFSFIRKIIREVHFREIQFEFSTDLTEKFKRVVSSDTQIMINPRLIIDLCIPDILPKVRQNALPLPVHARSHATGAQVPPLGGCVCC